MKPISMYAIYDIVPHIIVTQNKYMHGRER